MKKESWVSLRVLIDLGVGLVATAILSILTSVSGPLVQHLVQSTFNSG